MAPEGGPRPLFAIPGSLPRPARVMMPSKGCGPARTGALRPNGGNKTMQYRKLGQTGMIVSAVGIGTWQLGGEWGKSFTQDEVNAIFDAAREEGINLVDTAECYGPHTAEALIGQAVKRDREQWLIATKFGHQYLRWMERSEDYSAVAMRRQLEESLRALKTDYVDIYQVHGVSYLTAQDDVLWDELERLKARGVIRAIGVSIRNDPALLERKAIDVAQILYNRLNRSAEETVFPVCQSRGIGVLSRVPLASGLLSGKYRPGHAWEPGDVRTRQNADQVERDLREVERIGKEEVPPGVSMAQWALAWCLRHPAVSTVIPGCKSAEQLRANAAAVNLLEEAAAHPQAA